MGIMTSVTNCSSSVTVLTLHTETWLNNTMLLFFLHANSSYKVQVFFGGIFTTTGLIMLCWLIILDVIFLMTLTGPEKDFNIWEGGGIDRSSLKVPKRNLNFGKLISCSSKIVRIFAPSLADPHVPCSFCPIGALMPSLSLSLPQHTRANMKEVNINS